MQCHYIKEAKLWASNIKTPKCCFIMAIKVATSKTMMSPFV